MGDQLIGKWATMAYGNIMQLSKSFCKTIAIWAVSRRCEFERSM